METNKKKILVTGACGFIGSYLVKALIESGFEINIFDFDTVINSKDKPSPFIKKNNTKINFFSGNIEDPNNLDNAIKGVDHVFHLAARSFVPDSWKFPFDFYRTNIMGTANVLEACRKNNCSITYISSYVYGTPKYLPIDELHPVQSYNPYCHSKVLAEEVCNYYKDNYGLKITVFRPFNVYGPGQNENFLIPEIIGQLLSEKNKKIIINDLVPKRDYLFVDDLINALVLSISSTGDIFNLGSGYSISVEELIKTAIEISGIEKKYISRNSKRENEVYDVVADIKKAKALLNWSPKTSLREGIGNCIEFYKRNINSEV
jgi:nucleoside-diphosphate-sugar epimerase